MAHKQDWLPTTRQGQLDMAVMWQKVFTEKVKPEGVQEAVPKWTVWGIPELMVLDLETLVKKAEESLSIAKNEETRTSVTNRTCENAFKELVVPMRDIKRRYFFQPPLKDNDIQSLGLKIPDKTPTAAGSPTAQMAVRTFLKGTHQLGITLDYVSGGADDAANKEFRVYYKVVASGEDIPTSPSDTWKSFSTKRKRDIIDFEYEDSGKTVYFAVRIENRRKQGPWGPIVSAVIP